MKRKPMLRRKGAPAVIIALGGPPKEREAPEEEMAEDGLTCPKCGAELADTPENRKYVEMRSDEMDESEDESDDEMDDED